MKALDARSFATFVRYLFSLSLVVAMIALGVRWVDANVSRVAVFRTVELRSALIWIWPILLVGTLGSLVLALSSADSRRGRHAAWLVYGQIGVAVVGVLGVASMPEFLRVVDDSARPQIWSLAGPSLQVYASAVYFGNDSALPASTDIVRLAARARELEKCRLLGAVVTAFTSSAEYHSDNEGKNLSLAARRAASVTKVIGGLGVAATVVPWKSLGAMRQAEGFYLDRIGGTREKERESLNRRVDIIWRVVNCRGDSIGEAHPIELKGSP